MFWPRGAPRTQTPPGERAQNAGCVLSTREGPPERGGCVGEAWVAALSVGDKDGGRTQRERSVLERGENAAKTQHAAKTQKAGQNAERSVLALLRLSAFYPFIRSY